MSIIHKENKDVITSHTEELELLDKTELIKKIIQLEENNKELEAIVSRINKKLRKRNIAPKTQKSFDFQGCNKRHILLKFYYLGWDYDGFVVQESIDSTIEDYIFTALMKSCCIKSRQTSNYHRCGRTDKGVSSFSQVISLDVRSRLKLEDQCKLKDELPYCKILNRLLPSNIRCIAWCPVTSDFSARFNCKFRTYKYFFPRGNLNIHAMDKAIKYTMGEHDFRNICKMDVANGVTNYKRTIIDAKVSTHRQNLKNNAGCATRMLYNCSMVIYLCVCPDDMGEACMNICSHTQTLCQQTRILCICFANTSAVLWNFCLTSYSQDIVELLAKQMLTLGHRMLEHNAESECRVILTHSEERKGDRRLLQQTSYGRGQNDDPAFSVRGLTL